MRRRHELTDEQWEAIRDLLPGKAGDLGRTAVDNRLFVNAVLFLAKTGIDLLGGSARAVRQMEHGLEAVRSLVCE